MFDLMIIAFSGVSVGLLHPLLCLVRINLAGPVIACVGAWPIAGHKKVKKESVKLDLKVNKTDEHIHSTAEHTKQPRL
jgi:hypothetical protein